MTSSTFIIQFDPALSPEQVTGTLTALADYYRACGGVGLEITPMGDHMEQTVTYSSLRESLVATIAQAPEADIQDSQMLCTSCKKSAEPRLIEYGFSRDNRFAGVEAGQVRAHQGGSEDYSEDADTAFLECGSCGSIYRIPQSMTIRWLSIDES